MSEEAVPSYEASSSQEMKRDEAVGELKCELRHRIGRLAFQLSRHLSLSCLVESQKLI